MRVIHDTTAVSVDAVRSFQPTVVEVRVPALGVFPSDTGEAELLLAFDSRLTPIGDDWKTMGGAMAADLPNPNSLGLVRGLLQKDSLSFNQPFLWRSGSKQPKEGFSDPCILTSGDTVVVVHARSADVGFFGSAGYRDSQQRDTLFISVARSTDRGKTWTYSDATASVYGSFAGIFATSGHGVVIDYPHGQTFVVPLVARCFDGTTKHLTMRSADKGLTWVAGEPVGTDMDETAYGLLDGKLVLSARRTSAYKTGELGRFTAVSEDAGLTWSDPQWDTSLPVAACNAALISTPQGLVFAYCGAGRKTGHLALKRSLNTEFVYLGEFTNGPCGYVEGAYVGDKIVLCYEVPEGIRACIIEL